jgi:hypothetical protein
LYLHASCKGAPKHPLNHDRRRISTLKPCFFLLAQYKEVSDVHDAGDSEASRKKRYRSSGKQAQGGAAFASARGMWLQRTPGLRSGLPRRQRGMPGTRLLAGHGRRNLRV